MNTTSSSSRAQPRTRGAPLPSSNSINASLAHSLLHDDSAATAFGSSNGYSGTMSVAAAVALLSEPMTSAGLRGRVQADSGLDLSGMSDEGEGKGGGARINASLFAHAAARQVERCRADLQVCAL